MSVTVNLRNNTDFWVKVNGLDEIINPNTPLDDRTYQWISTENKLIKFFNNISCEGSPVMTATLTFNVNEGIKLNRGELIGQQVVKLSADCGSTRLEQEENMEDTLLSDWESINSETVVNMDFKK